MPCADDCLLLKPAQKGSPILDEETLRIWTHFCCPHVFLSLCKALKSLLTYKVEREK